LLNGDVVDVSSFGEDYTEEFLAKDGLNRLSTWLKTNASLPKVDKSVRMGCPVVKPSKIICVGLNYTKHALESNMPLPKEPIIFFKATTALTGPNDSLIIPKNSVKTDWEVELAVVIGEKSFLCGRTGCVGLCGGFLSSQRLQRTRISTGKKRPVGKRARAAIHLLQLGLISLPKTT
jgi:hypothetical protein